MLARNFFRIITVKVCWTKKQERLEHRKTKKGNWKIKPSFTLLEFCKVGPGVGLTRMCVLRRSTKWTVHGEELLKERGDHEWMMDDAIAAARTRRDLKIYAVLCCAERRLNKIEDLLEERKNEEDMKKLAARKRRRSRFPRRNEDPEIWEGHLSPNQSSIIDKKTFISLYQSIYQW